MRQIEIGQDSGVHNEEGAQYYKFEENKVFTVTFKDEPQLVDKDEIGVAGQQTKHKGTQILAFDEVEQITIIFCPLSNLWRQILDLARKNKITKLKGQTLTGMRKGTAYNKNTGMSYAVFVNVAFIDTPARSTKKLTEEEEAFRQKEQIKESIENNLKADIKEMIKLMKLRTGKNKVDINAGTVMKELLIKFPKYKTNDAMSVIDAVNSVLE